jgi:hypothetical protein
MTDFVEYLILMLLLFALPLWIAVITQRRRFNKQVQKLDVILTNFIAHTTAEKYQMDLDLKKFLEAIKERSTLEQQKLLQCNAVIAAIEANFTVIPTNT